MFGRPKRAKLMGQLHKKRPRKLVPLPRMANVRSLSFFAPRCSRSISRVTPFEAIFSIQARSHDRGPAVRCRQRSRCSHRRATFARAIKGPIHHKACPIGTSRAIRCQYGQVSFLIPFKGTEGSFSSVVSKDSQEERC